MNKKTQRIIVIVLAAALLLTVLVPALSLLGSAAVTQGDIQNIKDELTDIKEQKKEADARLAAIRDDLSKAKEQMELIQPKIVVCLGRIAAMRLIKPDYRITKEHGQWVEKDGVLYTAIYHPAALLRDPTKKPDTFADLRGIRAKIRELCPEAYR